MRVIDATVIFFLVAAAFSANAGDVQEACISPTAGQKILYCKRIALQISNKQVMDLVTQNMRDYQANDRDILAKAHLPTAAGEFAKAHKSWAAFKESTCKAEYMYAGSGALREIEYLDCLFDFNKRRVEQLQ